MRKIQCFLLFLLIILIVISTVTYAKSSQVEVGTAIDFTRSVLWPSHNKHVVRSSNGTYYASFVSFNSTRLNNSLFIYRSEDFGSNWNRIQDIQIDDTKFKYNEMWVNSTDGIYISIFQSEDEGSYDNFSTYYSDNGFSSYTNITTNLPYLKYGGISAYIDGNDQIYGCLIVGYPNPIIDYYGLVFMNWSNNNWNYTTENKYFIDNETNNNDPQDCQLLKDNSGMFHAFLNNGTSITHYNSTGLTGNWTRTAIPSGGTGMVSLEGTVEFSADYNTNNHLFVVHSGNSTSAGDASGAKNHNFANSTTNGITWTVSPPQVNVRTLKSGLSMMVDDTNNTRVLGYAVNGLVTYLVHSVKSNPYGRDFDNGFVIHGDSITGNDLNNPSIGNRHYPSFNNNSRLLRYLYYDKDDHKIFYDSINISLASINPNVTTPNLIGVNRSNRNLTFQTKYYDENRDDGNITINWYRNGSLIYSDNSTNVKAGAFVNLTLDARNLTKGDMINVTVRSTDNFSLSSNLINSSIIRVGNAFPEVSSVAVSITSPLENQNIGCNYTYTDNDSDVRGGTEYRWYKSNIFQNITTGNLSNLNISRSESWHCEVRANDSTDWSNWTNSSSVTIGAYVASTSSASTGGGPIKKEIEELSRFYPANLTDYCGDGYCAEDENPDNCWDDCRVNLDSLLTCIWNDDIECNYEQAWFPMVLIVSLIIITGGAVYYYDVKGKKRRFRRGV